MQVKREELKRYMIPLLHFLITLVVFFICEWFLQSVYNGWDIRFIRPSFSLHPAFALLWGWPGALGAVIGNLLADHVIGLTQPIVASFLGQLFFGIFPYYLWKWRGGKPRLNNAEKFRRYILIMLADSAVSGMALGFVVYLTGGSDVVLSDGAQIIMMHDFVFGMILGVPVLVLGNVLRERKKLTLNEQFTLHFLSFIVISGLILSVFGWIEMIGDGLSRSALWKRIYGWVSADVLIMSVISVGILRYIEKNITKPLEEISLVSRKHIMTGEQNYFQPEEILTTLEENTYKRGKSGIWSVLTRS